MVEFEETNKAIEKFNQSIGKLGECLLEPFLKCAEKLREVLIPLQMELCKEFAEEKGFEIKLEAKSRGYRIKLRWRHWFKIPISRWHEIGRGGHSMSDAVNITDELRCYL